VPPTDGLYLARSPGGRACQQETKLAKGLRSFRDRARKKRSHRVGLFCALNGKGMRAGE
jgi:hypothetical protein